MKGSVWVGASRRRIGRGFLLPYWPALSRGKAQAYLDRAGQYGMPRRDKPMQRREATIQARVGVLSLSGGSGLNRRPRKGLERKLTLGNSYRPLAKNLCSDSVIAFLAYGLFLLPKVNWNGKPGPKGAPILINIQPGNIPTG